MFSRASPQPAHALDRALVPISNGARVLVVLYFAFWRVLPLFGNLGIDPDTSALTALMLFLVNVGSEFLLLLPFLVQRIAGTPVGWLHPLVLPMMLGIAKELVKSPAALLAPLGLWSDFDAFIAEPVPSGSGSLQHELELRLKQDGLLLLAQVAYLAGFLSYSRRPRAGPERGAIRIVTGRMLLVVAVSVLTFLVVVSMSGGIVEHFSSLALGRYRMRETIGPLLILVNILPYVMIAWYVFRPALIVHPVFLAGFALALAIQFGTTGSRSALIVPVACLLATWMFVRRQVPGKAAVVTVLVVLLGFGVLGEVRNSASGNEGTAEVSFLSEVGLLAAAQKTFEEAQKRIAESGQTAVMRAVPGEVPHLYGATYISSIAFFVPRTLWPDKPRGPGAHAGALIFAGEASAKGYEGTAYPVGGMGEAYWNFGFVGVVVVYLVFGLFHRWMVQRLLSRPGDRFAGLIYVLSLILLPDIDSESIVGFAQALVLLVVIVRLTGSTAAGRPAQLPRPTADAARA